MNCTFCQNDWINLECQGRSVTVDELADAFLSLEALGCHNLHWVSPTQQLPWLLEALYEARRRGLRLPLVYNTGGYETLDTLRLLDGVVDIYLPDFKFWHEASARRYLKVEGYPQVARDSLREMLRQVGHLVCDANGVALRGLLVRYLVMPGSQDEARSIFNWISQELGPESHLNIMSQYEPHHRASRYPELDRRTSRVEWEEAVSLARAAGLHKLLGVERPDAPPQYQRCYPVASRMGGGWHG